jgi:hypothetical protein
MKKLSILFILVFALILLTAGATYASNIYVTDDSSANIKVYIAEYQSDADLCVYVANYESDARNKDEIWYFVKYSSDAKAKIRFVKYKSDADLVIYYVKYQSDAGWKKSNQYRGRL